MDFISHASSSSANSYELRSGDHRLALECGLPWSKMQKAFAFQTSGLDGLLLTHSHGDHCRAASKVVNAGINLYASQETAEAIGLVGHHRFMAIEAQKPYGSLKTFIAGPWRCTAFETIHDAPGSLGFLVGAPDGDRILFATDTAYAPAVANGCTHLAVECSYSDETLRASDYDPDHRVRIIKNHMSLERLLGMLGSFDLSKLREIHLLHISDQGDAPAFVDAVRRATGKPVYAAPK